MFLLSYFWSELKKHNKSKKNLSKLPLQLFYTKIKKKMKTNVWRHIDRFFQLFFAQAWRKMYESVYSEAIKPWGAHWSCMSKKNYPSKCPILRRFLPISWIFRPYWHRKHMESYIFLKDNLIMHNSFKEREQKVSIPELNNFFRTLSHKCTSDLEPCHMGVSFVR